MSMTLTEKPVSPQFSGNLKIHDYTDTEDIGLLTKASNHCWGDLWGHKIVTEEQRKIIREKFRLDAIFLLFNDTELVGISSPSLSKDVASKGVLDSSGIVPEYRSPELYKALALFGLGWLYEQGRTEINLESWGDADTTIQVYQDLGFEPEVLELGYRRSLTI